MNAGQVLAILWARKFTFLTMFATVVGVATIITYLLPKTYIATASLVVDLKVTDPLTGLAVPSFQTMSTYMATQVDVISSRRVSRKVVDALKLVENSLAKQQFECGFGGGIDLDVVLQLVHGVSPFSYGN